MLWNGYHALLWSWLDRAVWVIHSVLLIHERAVNTSTWSSCSCESFPFDLCLTIIWMSHHAIIHIRPTIVRLNGVILFLPYLNKIGPAWFRRAIVNLIPSKLVQLLKKIINVMEETSVEIVQKKRKALQLGEETVVKQIGKGKDILSTLCKLCAISLF